MKHLPLIILLLLSNCKDRGVDPPPQKPVVILTAEDVGVTEVWLLLKTQNVTLPSAVKLLRLPAGSLAGNGDTLTTFTLTTSDTVFADTTAQPKQNYIYEAIVQNDTSNQLQVTTMDTTSHNFTWQTFTFGGEAGTGSSVLYDVAIINDTLAYAVGAIYVKDSAGNEITYNALKWDGTKWNPLRILVRDWGGGMLYAPITTVFAFDVNDVWFGAYADLIQWNGSTFTSKAFFATELPFTGQIQKMWGTDANDIYCVGLGGAIYHYTGSSWSKLESGTTATINDIWGAVNQTTGERTILCAVSEFLQPGDRKILSITLQNKVDTIAWVPQREVRSVWFPSSKTILTAGEGIFIRNYLRQWREFTETPRIYSDKIRGIALNDIVAVGSFGMVLHYNGKTWKYFDNFYGQYIWNSHDYKNNTLITVGYTGGINGVAKILYGKHN